MGAALRAAKGKGVLDRCGCAAGRGRYFVAKSDNKHDQMYPTGLSWNDPVNSYLYVNAAGGLTRVEYILGRQRGPQGLLRQVQLHR